MAYVVDLQPEFTAAMAAYPYSAAIEQKFQFISRFGDSVNMSHRDGNMLYVPREVVPMGKIDYRKSYPPVAINCNFEPRHDEQRDLTQKSINLLKAGYSHVFNAPTGWGKSVCATVIACALGQPTIIVVNKEDLMDSWYDAIVNVLGVAPELVGKIQQDVCDWEGKRLVLAMAHSICIPDRYPAEMFRYFGMLIVDEVHTIPTEFFGRVFQLFPAKYRLGFSATTDRSDGKWQVVTYNIGPVLVAGTMVPMRPKILVKQTGWKIPRRKVWVNGFLEEKPIPYAPGRMTMVTKAMAANTARNMEIVKFTKAAYASGRVTLILSELIDDHLKRLFLLLTEHGIPGQDIGYYIGGMTKEQREVTKKAKVVLACVSEDTECLTLRGWKHYTELEVGELVASYNIERQVVEYVPLQGVHPYEFDGQLCQVKKDKTVDILMTFNHKNVCSTRKGVEYLCRADELRPSDRLILSAPVDYPVNSGIGVDIAALMGWIVAEGTYADGTNGTGIKLHQNEGWKADEIRRLLRVLEIPHTEYAPRGPKNHIVWRIKSSAAKKLKILSPDKRLNEFLIGLPQKEAEALFNALIDGDGCRSGGKLVWIQKNKACVDWFCVLALRMGYRPKIGTSHDGKGHYAYHVYLSKHHSVGLDNNTKKTPIPYKGVVWCPSTRNGTWVARRNGTVFVTGNTYKMVKEGTNVPHWDSCVFATPRSDVRQAIGRILRFVAGKKQPVALDLVDWDKIYQGFHMSRVKQYYQLQAEIVRMT